MFKFQNAKDVAKVLRTPLCIDLPPLLMKK